MKTNHLIIHGHVQGVGFRNSTTTLAKQQGLAGSVKNKHDNTVEIMLQATDQQLENFIYKLKQKETNPFARVQRVQIMPQLDQPEMDDFKTIY